MTIFSSGISMYALGLLFELVLGWNFTNSVLLSAAIVLVYTLLGGLTSAIYNEVVQFFLIVLGFAPLSILATERAGGWTGIKERLQPVMTHSWRYVGHASENPMGVEVFGLVAGLGFVLSFGYWCTNFLVIQRAMAADSMDGARQTPLFAAFPKILMPFVVILPGIAAVALMNTSTGYTLPLNAHGGGYNYNQVLTTLMAKFYPSGMLGIGLTALMASFMSGMAGNVTAFNTVFTYDIYQSYIKRDAPDAITCGWGESRPLLACSFRSPLLISRPTSTTSWTSCSWSSASSTLLCLRPSCWACSGSAPRATEHSGDCLPEPAALCDLRPDRRRKSRRLVRQFPRVPVRHGPKLLGCHRRLDRLPRPDLPHQSGHETQAGIGSAQPGLRLHRNSSRIRRTLVSAPGSAGHYRHRRPGDYEYYFLVNNYG